MRAAGFGSEQRLVTAGVSVRAAAFGFRLRATAVTVSFWYVHSSYSTVTLDGGTKRVFRVAGFRGARSWAHLLRA